MNNWTYENFFYLTSKKLRILKILDHYEIYKKIFNVKGDVVECGVFKGASLIRLLTFRDLYENSKKEKFMDLMRLENFQDLKIKRFLQKN